MIKECSALLISPYTINSRYPIYMPSENLGIAYLTSFMRKNGINVDILDANMLEITADEICNYFSCDDYNLIGISVSSSLLIDESIRIANVIKKLNNDIHITLGGHFATFNHIDILKIFKNINSVIRYDGEETILELINNLHNNNFKSIKGLTYRDIDGRINVNINRELINNLDILPWPARDTLNYIKKLNHPWPTQITSSRGCYGSCSFCDIKAFYGRYWRCRSAIDVVNEVEYLHKEYGSKLFRFTDDEFIGPHSIGVKRVEEISKELIKRNIKVELMIDARVQSIERRLFELLKKAGVTSCLVGVESGVDRVLKLYNKGTNVKKIIDAINLLKEIGIKLDLAFIMFDPRMTFNELIENYYFLKEHNILSVESLNSWLWPLDGTQIRKELIKDKLIKIESINNINYRFIDLNVEKVFRYIDKCKEITFDLEKELFKIKKHSYLNTSNQELISNNYLNLWINIFELCINNPDINDFSFPIKVSKSILNQIKVN